MNDAQNAVAYEVDFPEAQYKIETEAGVTEYQLVDLVKIFRVYLAQYPNNDPTQQPTFQQALVPVDIDLLEGDSLEQWDGGQQTPPTGYPANTPAWLAQQQQPSQYPVTSMFNRTPVPTGLPWRLQAFGNQRPRYYLRGGNIGIVPTPNLGTYWIVVDHVPVPFGMQQSSDLSAFPARFKDAIAYKVCEYASLADKSSDSEVYQAKYELELGKLRQWRTTLQVNQPNKVLPITKRTWFRRRRTGWN